MNQTQIETYMSQQFDDHGNRINSIAEEENDEDINWKVIDRRKSKIIELAKELEQKINLWGIEFVLADLICYIQERE